MQIKCAPHQLTRSVQHQLTRGVQYQPIKSVQQAKKNWLLAESIFLPVGNPFILISTQTAHDGQFASAAPLLTIDQ